MKFVRHAVAPLRIETLRTLGAREGWLIETPEVIRMGAGRVVDRIELVGGLDATTSATSRALAPRAHRRRRPRGKRRRRLRRAAL